MTLWKRGRKILMKVPAEFKRRRDGGREGGMEGGMEGGREMEGWREGGRS